MDTFSSANVHKTPFKCRSVALQGDSVCLQHSLRCKSQFKGLKNWLDLQIWA